MLTCGSLASYPYFTESQWQETIIPGINSIRYPCKVKGILYQIASTDFVHAQFQNVLLRIPQLIPKGGKIVFDIPPRNGTSLVSSVEDAKTVLNLITTAAGYSPDVFVLKPTYIAGTIDTVDDAEQVINYYREAIYQLGLSREIYLPAVWSGVSGTYQEWDKYNSLKQPNGEDYPRTFWSWNYTEVDTVYNPGLTTVLFAGGGGSSFSGALSSVPIKPGTLVIYSVDKTLRLTDSDGVLSGTGGSGTIDYDTGDYIITTTAPLNSNVIAIHEYYTDYNFATPSSVVPYIKSCGFNIFNAILKSKKIISGELGISTPNNSGSFTRGYNWGYIDLWSDIMIKNIWGMILYTYMITKDVCYKPIWAGLQNSNGMSRSSTNGLFGNVVATTNLQTNPILDYLTGEL